MAAFLKTHQQQQTVSCAFTAASKGWVDITVDIVYICVCVCVCVCVCGGGIEEQKLVYILPHSLVRLWMWPQVT